MGKFDRTDALKKSVQAEKNSLTRFDMAEQVMGANPEGLPLTQAIVHHQHDKTESQIVKIRIDLLDDNPHNARHIYNQEKIKELATSIATQGQKYPVPVMHNPAAPGRYILIDGHYRKRANLAAGKSEIECLMQPIMNDLELYRVSFMLNHERSEQTALDNALAWQKLLNDGVIQKEEDLCDLTSLSASKINKTMALLKLSDLTKAVLEENPDKIGPAMGYELYLYETKFGVEAGLEMINRVISEDLSTRDVEVLRKKAERAPTRKPKETSRQYKIQSDKEQIGVLKEWDTGKVMLEVKFNSQEDKNTFLEEMKKRFGVSAD